MFGSLKQLWGILTPLDKRKIIYVLILVIGMALIESAGVISIMPFLAVLSNPSVIETTPILKRIYEILGVDNTEQMIVYLGIISFAVVVLSTIFKIITQYAVNRFSNLQRHYFSSRLLTIYLNQKYEFYIQNNSSLLIKNVLSEVDQLIGTMILPTLTMMSYGVVLFTMTGILLIYDPIMALGTAGILGSFYVSIFMLIKRKLSRIGAEFTQANKERYQSCQEALGGIKDVIINNAKQGYIEQFEKSSRVFARHIATRETLGQIPLNIIETIGYGSIIGLAILLVISGKDVSHILPVLGLYGFAAYRMLPAAQNIYRSISQLRFAQEVLRVLIPEFHLEKLNITSETVTKNAELKFEKVIRLENVSFAYPNRLDKPVLTNFSLEIKKNTSLGIMGKSGSGKSTLMDLMLGLLAPQRGKIYIDDVELTEQNVEAWCGLVGYVPQFIYLADKSVAENIAFGILKDQIDLEQVKKVAKLAQIDSFIMQNLKNGYEEIVGERGVMLSGGQRQRIGIARALYKNPEIIFMDEATSALDIETEQSVNEAIQCLNGKITMVIIAHRSSAIENCDFMYDLKNSVNI